jgi:hypothetical protein
VRTVIRQSSRARSSASTNLFSLRSISCIPCAATANSRRNGRGISEFAFRIWSTRGLGTARSSRYQCPGALRNGASSVGSPTTDGLACQGNLEKPCRPPSGKCRARASPASTRRRTRCGRRRAAHADCRAHQRSPAMIALFQTALCRCRAAKERQRALEAGMGDVVLQTQPIVMVLPGAWSALKFAQVSDRRHRHHLDV